MKTPMRIALAIAVLIAFELATDRLARSQSDPSEEAPFEGIARVLQSPRCMNCHPSGDAPLQTDASRPHKQYIKRAFSNLGGTCMTCHQAAPLPDRNTPPGAPHWTMPPAETPMVFQGKSVAQLCEDLKDPNQNGHRSLDDLVHHVSSDPLVLWGFNPGAGRTTPPMTHDAFIALISEWVALGAPCPTN